MAKTKEDIVKEARERISKLESSGGFVWTAKDQVLFTELCDIVNQGSDGWISVEDGNPDCGQYLICYYNPSDKYKKLYAIALWRGRDGWYYDGMETEPAEDQTLKVTHYMSFPKPPLTLSSSITK